MAEGPMRRARHLAPVVLGAAPIVAAVACYGATSMQVQVLTDLTCPERLQSAIYAGGDETHPVGETSSDDCLASDGATSLLGDLVFAPPSAGERTATVTVKVQLGVGAGVDAKRCKETPEVCVFASRKFTYVEHESRRLPVRLYRDCLGKVCAEGSTCVAGGRCVPDSASCQSGDCTLPDDTPFTPAPADAGADAAPPSDASIAAKCVAPDGSDVLVQLTAAMPTLVAASPTALYWGETNSLGWVIRRLDMATGTPVTEKTLAPGVTLDALAYGDGGVWWVDEIIVDGGAARTVHSAAGDFPAGDVKAPFALAVTPKGTPYPDVTALLADSSNIRKYGVAEKGDVLFATAASSLALEPARLLALDGNGALTAWPFVGKNPTVVAASDVGVIASDGTTVFAATGNAKAPKAAIHRVVDGALVMLTTTQDANASGLALDPTYVYWVEPGGNAGDGLYRVPRANLPTQSNTTTVLTARSDRTVKHVVPDGAPDGCIYYWSENPMQSGIIVQSTLRIASKP
jgi:hypothetical protein